MTNQKIKKIAVVTGSRADYGLLTPLIALLDEDKDVELQLIVCASHLSNEFGYTRRYIEQDGYEICSDIEMLVSGDTPVAVTKSVGLGCIGFSDCLSRLVPDILVLLGDRYEILAAAQTAMFLRLPVAHIHGGEITEGAIDDCIRHAVTKMSNLHFVATDEYKKRVIQLGEDPGRVYNTGAIGLDNITKHVKPERNDLERKLGIKLSKPLFLVTYHPETMSYEDESKAIDSIFNALEYWPEASIVVTGSNSDAGGIRINEQIRARVGSGKQNIIVRSSLGQELYLDLLSVSDCILGNSSSGIIEAPSFNVPTVNIGERQKGRIRATSIIDCDRESNSVKEAVQMALSKTFLESIKGLSNPYGDGDTAIKILEILKKANLDNMRVKTFFDVG